MLQLTGASGQLRLPVEGDIVPWHSQAPLVWLSHLMTGHVGSSVPLPSVLLDKLFLPLGLPSLEVTEAQCPGEFCGRQAALFSFFGRC